MNIKFYIYNSALPSDIKTGNVVTIYKSNNRTDVKKYRHVCLTSVVRVCKITVHPIAVNDRPELGKEELLLNVFRGGVKVK